MPSTEPTFEEAKEVIRKTYLNAVDAALEAVQEARAAMPGVPSSVLNGDDQIVGTLADAIKRAD